MRKTAENIITGRLGDLPGFFRTRDVESRGLSRKNLREMMTHGVIERVARGLYRRCDAMLTELETVAAVSKRIPGAVICLITALHIHDIGSQLSRNVWIAVDRKARKPTVNELPVRVVRYSKQMLEYSIETRVVLGVTVRITSPARTVVDCFRYRNKIGLDVALEALRDAVVTHKIRVDDIARIAGVCRIRSVIIPYLESVAS